MEIKAVSTMQILLALEPEGGGGGGAGAFIEPSCLPGVGTLFSSTGFFACPFH